MSRLPVLASLWLLVFVLPLGAQSVEDLHTTPEEVPVVALDVAGAFAGLTDQEKLYAHFMAEASWRGNLITFEQLSAESPALLEFFLRLYSVHPVSLRKTAHAAGLNEADLQALETYAARVFSNCGNYLSFGDAKFIPRIPAAQVSRLVHALAAQDLGGRARLVELWEQLQAPVYSLAPEVLGLGLDDDGVSAYYGEGVTKHDIELIARYLQSIALEAWNTRVIRGEDGNLEIHLASALEQPSRTSEFEGQTIRIVYGDYAEVLQRVVAAFAKALPQAANDHQRRMILSYIHHFNGGDIDDHKESQKHWVLDLGPVVETNIGFIETYRDPTAVRAEWEGLVAIVNKEQTRKFSTLVESAPSLIPLLPWPADFEKDSFRKPDFTSLEVLAFANSGIPLGINIPNYDDVRQNFGFKNVSLGNVARARGKGEGKISFILDSDHDLYAELADPSFEVQVGLHELLGHGSGKLLEERADGSFNFDRETVLDPFTRKPVATWYRPGETWGSLFTTIASSYEECRAEGVGLHLCTNPEVLKIFGHEGQAGQDIAYVNWLSMARSGLSALTFYDPTRQSWGQAHMQARFALLQVMLRAGGGLIELQQDDAGDWYVKLDREKIESVGKPAVADFLSRLNVYKATGNVAAGREIYLDYTAVDERFLAIRSYVLQTAKPRHIWVQPVTALNAAGEVILREYPATHRGVIDSFIDRYAEVFGISSN